MTAPEEEPILYDLNDVARLLRLSRRTVEKMIADGTIESIKVGSRRFVVPKKLAEAMDRLAYGGAA